MCHRRAVAVQVLILIEWQVPKLDQSLCAAVAVLPWLILGVIRRAA